jgi:hypothetical protein
MNIELTLLNFSEDQLKFYLDEIKKSNLPKEVQWELTDLLQTANIQIQQAKKMGWLNSNTPTRSGSMFMNRSKRISVTCYLLNRFNWSKRLSSASWF